MDTSEQLPITIGNCKVTIFVPPEEMAKVKTYLRDKTRPITTFFNEKKSRKGYHKISAGEFFATAGVAKVKNVKPDAEALEWLAEFRKKQEVLIKKHKADIAAGKFRIPEGVKRKPSGRVPGKSYPKWDEAMRKLQEMRTKGAKGTKDKAKTSKPSKKSK